MTTDTSIFGYFWHAGFVVKTVMLFLLAASVVSWTLIFQRGFLLRKIAQGFEAFESKFWSGIDLAQLYAKLVNSSEPQYGISKIFVSGFQAFADAKQQKSPPRKTLEATQRAMHIAETREVAKIEKHLSMLATIGSTSPYIGLFGTVWGIMHAFHALGQMQQATITMVAPGISEALVATAMGLFAAIPAVIAYNRFNYQVERLAQQYHTFQEEFFALLQRQAEGH